MTGEKQTIATLLDAAIAAHGTWKHRLRGIIENGGPAEDIDAAGRDDVCTLGRWLSTHWPAPAEQNSYDKVKKLHTEFHKVAGNIAQLSLKGDRAGAEKQLGVGSRYAQLSSELTLEMMRWKKVAG